MEQCSSSESVVVTCYERQCICIGAQERGLDTRIAYRGQNLDGDVSIVKVQCPLPQLKIESVSSSPHELPRIAEAYALRQLEKCVLRAGELEINQANELAPLRVSHLRLG